MMSHPAVNAKAAIARRGPTATGTLRRNRRGSSNVGTRILGRPELQEGKMGGLHRLLVAAAMAILSGRAAMAEPPLAIGYITKSATNQGWMLTNAGAADAAREAGVKLVVAGPSSQGALESQIESIKSVANQGVKAIALAPVDSAGVGPIVRRFSAAGIPFVAVDTDIDGGLATSYVATDNVAAASAQADWVADQTGPADRIILVEGSLAQSTGRERRQGFLDRLKQLRPGVEVIEVHTSWNLDEAQSGVDGILRSRQDVTLIANA
jgi:ABC-type sugar transport system substrate-binding protein